MVFIEGMRTGTGSAEPETGHHEWDEDREMVQRSKEIVFTYVMKTGKDPAKT
ncbi:hypothetical protein [Bacillus dakarensis]|uniref:hypothetical protein n=1 Tax=Robertmurraya dakarensis TaxID=1926278 RepID=UPI0012B6809F|nr:hypothetical protein [Bacillus dakarensis]